MSRHRFSTKLKKVSLMRLLSGAAMTSRAGVICELSDFEVEVYDHGGVYLHGNHGTAGQRRDVTR